MSDMNQKFYDAMFGNMEIYPYSGRFMFGKDCIGINDDSGNIAKVITDVIANYLSYHDIGSNSFEAEKLYGITSRARWDSMGRGIVVYFPDVNWNHDDWYVSPDKDE